MMPDVASIYKNDFVRHFARRFMAAEAIPYPIPESEPLHLRRRNTCHFPCYGLIE
jgi:hypothetical protein